MTTHVLELIHGNHHSQHSQHSKMDKKQPETQTQVGGKQKIQESKERKTQLIN